MARTLPPVFVSHGAPTILVDDDPGRHFLEQLGQDLIAAHGRPDAIVCISAHFTSDNPRVGAATAPEMIFDFYGFPAELYSRHYAARGDRALAERVAALIDAAGMPADIDPAQGLDHGAWVPLSLMFPAADIPVVPLSIQPRLDPAHHRALGAALAPLAGDNVLILGSGGAVHNVRDAMLRRHHRMPDPPDWAIAFDGWLADHIAAGDVAALDDYRARAPGARCAQPQDDHLMPLYVALGAAGAGAVGRRLHGSFSYGSLSLSSWSFAA